LKKILQQSLQTWWLLVKLTVPALIAVRLMMWFGMVDLVSKPFEPLMTLIGLPKETALIWVTAMLTNNYTGIVVYLDLLPAMGPQTVLQATVIGSVILIAHNLPVESGVCRGAGVSPLRMTILRIIAALFYGFLINRIGLAFGLGQTQAQFIISFQTNPMPSWGAWLVGCFKSLIMIYLIATFLLFMMAGFRKAGLLKVMTSILSPLLKLSGVGPKAAMITIFGMLLGLAYGGGLIISEARAGHVPKPDIFGSVTLMALCHSLVEDTLILGTLGGSFWGLLVGRLIFATVMTSLIVKGAHSNSLKSLVVGKKYF
jgi:spore maturation protein SpmB